MNEPPKSSLSPTLELLRRTSNVFVPLLLGALMVFAAVPRGWLPSQGTVSDARNRLSDGLRFISISQSWRMYAPNPSRSHMYMTMEAVYADGRREALEESRLARQGWGTQWMWKKSHRDILRHQVISAKIDRPSRNRAWYLRGICVREAMKNGEAPLRIEMSRVKRRFRSPDRVREGKAVLSRSKTAAVATGRCNTLMVKLMIDRAKTRAAGEHWQDPRPRAQAKRGTRG